MHDETHNNPSAQGSRLSRSKHLLGTAWLLGCITAALLVMFGPWSGGNSPAPDELPSAEPTLNIQPVSDNNPTSHLNQLASKPIDQIRLGDRVIAKNPEVGNEERALFEDPDPLRWRAVELTMLKDTGRRLDIALLRHEMWFWLNGAEVGSVVYIDLPEMGAQGFAEVLSISLCPRLQPGEGSIVTGTFRHESDQPLLEISVEGSEEPIVGTSNHPFWSEDQQTFIEASELHQGERVRTANDEIRHITRITHGPPPQAVYNIEVHSEHVYHVGVAGVLVHNSCGLTESQLDRFSQTALSVIVAGRVKGYRKIDVLNAIRAQHGRKLTGKQYDAVLQNLRDTFFKDVKVTKNAAGDTLVDFGPWAHAGRTYGAADLGIDIFPRSAGAARSTDLLRAQHIRDLNKLDGFSDSIMTWHHMADTGQFQWVHAGIHDLFKPHVGLARWNLIP